MIIVKFILSALFAVSMMKNVNCYNAFDNLNATEFNKLIDSLSGGGQNSQLTPGLSKSVADIRRTLTSQINDSLSLLPPTVVSQIQPQIDNLTAIINSFNSLADFSKFNSTVYEAFRRVNSTLFFLTFASNNIDKKMVNSINLDVYQPNLNASGAFVMEFQNYMLQNKSVMYWYMTFVNNLTQNQLNALAVAIETPVQDSVKNKLFDAIYKILSANDSILSVFELNYLDSNAKWNSSHILQLSPIIPYMTCFYLKKIDYNDLVSVWISKNINLDLQSMDKLCRCNMNFLNNAVLSYASLNTDQKAFIGSYMVDYLLRVGLKDPALIIDKIGPFIGLIPATKLNSILNLDPAVALTLFTKYNVKLSFQTFPKDWRSVVATYAATYLSSIKNRTFTVQELDMLTTVVFEMQYETIASLLDLNNNYQVLLNFTDNVLPFWWLQNRDLCNQFFNYLSFKSITTKDPLISVKRLQPLVRCRDNCDFTTLLTNKTSADVLSLAKNFLPYIDENVVCSCSKSLGSFLKSCTNSSACTQSDLVLSTNNFTIPLCAIFNPSEIKNFPDAVLASSRRLLTATNIDPQTAKDMIRKMNANNLSVSDLGNLISGVSTDYIAAQSDAAIAGVIDTILKYCESIDLPRLSLAIGKYFNHAFTTNTIKLAVIKVIIKNSPNCFNAIDINQFINSSITLADIPADIVNQVPKKLLLPLMSSLSVTSLSTSNAANYPINGATLNDLEKFMQRSDAIDIISKLNIEDLNSFRLKYLYDALLTQLSNFGISNPFIYLTDTLADRINPLLFIQISRENLTLLAQSPAFGTIVKKLSKISKDRCVDFPAGYIQNFTDVVMQYLSLHNRTTLSAADLDLIGPFLAVQLPMRYITIIDAKSFFSRLYYFKSICFQPNAMDSQIFASYLGNVFSQEKPNVADLEDLIVYLPTYSFSSLSQDQYSLFVKNAPDLLNSVQNNRDNMTEKVKNQRRISGLSEFDDMDLKSRMSSLTSYLFSMQYTSMYYGSSGYSMYYNPTINSMYSGSTSMMMGKKKRQTTNPLTCEQILTLTSSTGYGVSQFKLSDLTNLAQDDFEDCLFIFGNSSNNLPDTYITAFYQKLKGAYPILSQFPEYLISDLGIIAYKFTPAELSQLPIDSVDTASDLGALEGFSSDQMIAIVSNLKSNNISLNNGDNLMLIGNLACGLSSSDISSVSVQNFNDALPSLSEITATNCGNLNSWWGKAREATTSTNLFSVNYLSSIGSIAAGMNSTDLKNMDASKINVLSVSAFLIMPESLKTEIKNNPNLKAGLEPLQQSAIGLLDVKSATVTPSVIASNGYSISASIIGIAILLVSTIQLF